MDAYSRSEAQMKPDERSVVLSSSGTLEAAGREYRLAFRPRPGPSRYILLEGKEAFMAKDELYIERREKGDYAIRKPGSERASATGKTQAEAIERARQLNPDAAIHVERVRDTSVGGRDKWRRL